MTTMGYVQKKAEELKRGDMFVYYAVMSDGLYPAPERILDIKPGEEKKLSVILADGRTLPLNPETIVVIQEYA